MCNNCYTTMNIPNGRYLGYPECCVQEFGDIAKPAVFKPEVVRKQAFNGFLPCEKCATLLSIGVITRQNMIDTINSNRLCSVPFKERHTIEEDTLISDELWNLIAQQHG